MDWFCLAQADLADRMVISRTLQIVEAVGSAVVWYVRWNLRFLTTDPSDELCAAATWETGDAVFRVPVAVLEEYQAEYRTLCNKFKSLPPSIIQHHRTLQGVVFALSACAVWQLYLGNSMLGLVLWFTPLLLVPLSLASSISIFISNFAFEGPTLLCMTLVQIVCTLALPESVQVRSSITDTFILVYLSAHYTLSFGVYLRQQYATSLSNLLWSIAYSSQSTMILITPLLVMRNMQFSFSWTTVLIMAFTTRYLEAFVPVSVLSSMQYFQHVVAHLPGVYAQSHKWHHEIRDTTPFDTGFGGVGFPELLFRPLWDLIPILVNGVPFTVTYSFFFYALSSKLAHGHNDDAPYHWEHHMHFNVNFDDHRLSLMDVVFGTFMHKLPHHHTYGYIVDRRNDACHAVISVTKDKNCPYPPGEPYFPALPSWFRRLGLPTA